MVIRQARPSPDSTIHELLSMLVLFEKLGMKKVQERLEVLKELKERIENNHCTKDELLTIADAYPHRLNQKVSA